MEPLFLLLERLILGVQGCVVCADRRSHFLQLGLELIHLFLRNLELFAVLIEPLRVPDLPQKNACMSPGADYSQQTM